VNDAVNLEELARLAGVSRSTVSRVINGERWVSDAARERVEEAIRAHHYHPNSSARGLASRRTRILGVLIPTQLSAIFAEPFFAQLIQGAVEACNAHDHNLMLLMDPSADPLIAQRLYRRVIQGRHLDGIVIAASVVEDPIIGQLEADRFPFVLVGRHPERQISFVDADNRAAAQQAVAHLLGHGYLPIAMIAGAPNMIASIDRHAGYVSALEEAGISADPRLVVHGDFTRRGGYRAMQTLLARADGAPRAVFVASDTMASGALQALRDAGCRVPEDVAVMGFDGLEQTTVSLPILSTVVQPTAALGSEAVQVLLDLIASPERGPVQRFLPTELLLRRSCGCGNLEAVADANQPSVREGTRPSVGSRA
jgi:LacI family transcriptional regulator